jgi:hypothetical protein
MILEIHWSHGSLDYIYTALSTLKPSTSPLLSCIHLCFGGYFILGTSNLENLANDLRQIADEYSRIEREYKGAVYLTVFRTKSFEEFDTFNVRFFISVVVDDT